MDMELQTTTLGLDFEAGDCIAQATYIRKSTVDSKTEIIFLTSYSAEGTVQNNWVRDYLSENKESLYITALRNMKRMLNFAQLNVSLLGGDITDEEFEAELEDNEDKYLLPEATQKATLRQIAQTSDIVKKLEFMNDSSVDDASELFGLDFSDAMQTIENKKILAV